MAQVIKEMTINRSYLGDLQIRLIHIAGNHIAKPYRVKRASVVVGAFNTYSDALERYNSFRPLNGAGISED